MRRPFFRTGVAAALLTGLVLAAAPGVFAVTTADLSVTMTGPTRIKSGDYYTYSITVSNLGPDIATKITVMGGGGDQIDEVSVQCQDNGSFGQRQCTPSDLAPGASMIATYTLRVSGLVKGENRNAFVSGSVSQDSLDDPNPDNNQVQLAVHISGKPVK